MSYLGSLRSEERSLQVFSGVAIAEILSRTPGCGKHFHSSMVECCYDVNCVRERERRPREAPNHTEH